MSLTGLDLRKRLRQRLVSLLDAAVDHLDDDVDDATPATQPPAPEPVPPTPPRATAPSPAAAAAQPLKPLPELDKALKPLPKPKEPKEPKANEPKAAAAGGPTPAAKKAMASAEDRAAAHWDRTRRGVLRFVHDNGGKATLRDLHAYSERTFFVAHVKFSKLMEELTGEELLDYDHDTAEASLTEAGLAELG